MTQMLGKLIAPLKRLRIGETLIRRNPLFYQRARQRFASLEAASLEERRRWTYEQLRVVLRRSLKSAYGRAISGTTDIESWPYLDSATVRKSPETFQSGWHGWHIPATTGGTTGTPLLVSRSISALTVEQAALDHLLTKAGVDPLNARVAVMRGDDIKDPTDFDPPFWVRTQGGRRLVMSSNHLNARTVEDYVRELRDFGPDYLWVYPTALEALARLIRQRGLELRIPLVFSSSEMVHASTWKLVEQALDSRILDYYGQAERVALAYATSLGSYRMVPGYAHVELFERGSEDGRYIYEIVGTPLWNDAMTLVRYRTGDLIHTDSPLSRDEREAICLGAVTFEAIQGRDDEILVTADGTYLTGMNFVPRGVEHVVRIQIVQESPDHVRIRVLPDSGYSRADEERIMSNARGKIPGNIRIDLETVEALERTPRGKVPFVIRRGS